MNNFVNKNNDGNEDDGDEFEGMNMQQAFVKTTPMNNYRHRIFLDTVITGSQNYRKAVDVLETANEGDFINIIIDSIGGEISSSICLINAIRNSKATILGTLEQKAWSAGSLILLACPNIVVKPYATMMIHSGLMGVYPSPFERGTAQLSFFKSECERLMEEIYSGFLTEKELNTVMKGHEEIWLTDLEVIDRLGNLQKSRGAALKEPKKSKQKKGK